VGTIILLDFSPEKIDAALMMINDKEQDDNWRDKHQSTKAKAVTQNIYADFTVFLSSPFYYALRIYL